MVQRSDHGVEIVIKKVYCPTICRVLSPCQVVFWSGFSKELSLLFIFRVTPNPRMAPYSCHGRRSWLKIHDWDSRLIGKGALSFASDVRRVHITYSMEAWWLRLVVYHPRISLMGWTRIPQAWSTWFFLSAFNQLNLRVFLVGTNSTGKNHKFTRFRWYNAGLNGFVHPENWGRWTHFDSYFPIGLSLVVLSRPFLLETSNM